MLRMIYGSFPIGLSKQDLGEMAGYEQCFKCGEKRRLKK